MCAFLAVSALLALPQAATCQSFDSLYREAMRAYSIHDYATAAELFQKSIAYNPADSNAWLYLANSHIRLKRFDKAKAELAMLEALVPNSPEIPFTWGFYYGETGDMERALKHFQQAVKISPRMAGAHHNIGWCMASMGRYTAAIKSFEFALAIDSTLAETHHSLGAARFYNQNIEDPTAAEVERCIRHFDKALQMDSHLCAAHRSKALAYAFLNRHQQALASIEDWQHCSQPTPELYVLKAESHIALGNYTAARTSLQAALKQYPNHSPALLQMGMVEGLEGFGPDMYFEQCRKADPAMSPEITYCRARLSAYQKDNDNTTKWLLKASKAGRFSHLRSYRLMMADPLLKDYLKTPEGKKASQKIWKKNLKKYKKNNTFSGWYGG